MKDNRGFTLVELLVVVAIIAILASIVVPRVNDYLARARMAKAATEVRNMDLALTKMLADADRKDFSRFFTDTSDNIVNLFDYAILANAGSAEVYRIYSDLFYELLRRGRDADLHNLGQMGVDLKIDKAVKRKLGTQYMDVGFDPWGEPYQFVAGPWNKRALGISPLLRSYRGDPGDETFEYIYNIEKENEDKIMRGNPPLDTDYNGTEIPIIGYPAPTDIPVYIFSKGANLTADQPMTGFPMGAGDPNMCDDINNWDTGTGWAGWY